MGTAVQHRLSIQERQGGQPDRKGGRDDNKKLITIRGCLWMNCVLPNLYVKVITSSAMEVGSLHI